MACLCFEVQEVDGCSDMISERLVAKNEISACSGVDAVIDNFHEVAVTGKSRSSLVQKTNLRYSFCQ